MKIGTCIIKGKWGFEIESVIERNKRQDAGENHDHSWVREETCDREST